VIKKIRLRRARKVEDKKAISWMADKKENWGREEKMEMDHQKIKGMVPKKFHHWLKVFGNVKSERMCSEPTPEPELSQLLFYRCGQRDLVRVPISLVCLLIHISNGLCTYVRISEGWLV